MEGNDNHHNAQTRSLIFVCIARVFCAWFQSFVSHNVSFPVFGQLCLVGFLISRTELEKLRHTSNQDLAINPIFKCDECSYMAISRTILKRHTTMTHPNKDEPRPRGSSCWFLLFMDRAGKVKTHLSSGPCNKSYI